MLTRLKAAWRVLFSEQYIALTINDSNDKANLDYRCKHINLHIASLELDMEFMHQDERKQMNSLVSEAQAILEKKG